ncbi:MAG: flagellar hook capping protein [Lachnospiraceae bacterium]|nr:flagellar hook capping protein [Lachnospiraceae bacterium]
MSDIAISASTNPYVGSTYKAESNDRNTLNISDYFQLLAAQLANQDMTDPMSNGEMMQQLVQMAMAESVTSMTETMETMQAVSTQTYAASLIGQEISVAVVEDGVATGIKYGKVASVNFTSADPMIRLEGDMKEYPLSYVLGMGKIDDPYNAGETTPETGEDEVVDKVEGEEGTTTEETVTEPETSEENTVQEIPVE